MGKSMFLRKGECKGVGVEGVMRSDEVAKEAGRQVWSGAGRGGVGQSTGVLGPR